MFAAYFSKTAFWGAAAACLFSGNLSAHPEDLEGGHVPSNINYGFNIVGRDTLAGPGNSIYSDVWSHKGYGYVANFIGEGCTQGEVYIVDLQKAIKRYPGKVDGSMIATVEIGAGSWAQDVKVHEVGGRDILFIGHETCAEGGAEGISIIDVTKPKKPKVLVETFLFNPDDPSSTDGIHNVFAYDVGHKSYLIAVDSNDEFDNSVIIIDISDPSDPIEIRRTGVLEWLIDPETNPELAENQVFLGQSDFIIVHDVWVQKIGDQVQAVLSNWDLGFITVDVTDPLNPVVLGDSDYPDPDPITGLTPEGNAHAAVFGGANWEFIFAGDEDFAPEKGVNEQLLVNGEQIPFSATRNLQEELMGSTVYVGKACPGGPAVPAAPNDQAIAVVERGDCFFFEKFDAIREAGFTRGILFNSSSDAGGDPSRYCETDVPAGDFGIPLVAVPRSSGFAVLGIEGYDPGTCNGSDPDNGDALLADAGIGLQGQAVTMSAEVEFNGWGYFHVLNNKMETVTAPFRPTGEDRHIDYLGEMGYYAPSEVFDPELATGFGDLTMHNLEIDPTAQDRGPNFDEGPRTFIAWYSLGMRALEYRPGHFHRNLNGEGTFSWNVHEVGRYVADEGSNFWGVHVDKIALPKALAREARARVQAKRAQLRSLAVKLALAETRRNPNQEKIAKLQERLDKVRGELEAYEAKFDLYKGAKRGGEPQIIVASDMNLGLYIFTFDCVTEEETGTPFLYCDKPADP